MSCKTLLSLCLAALASLALTAQDLHIHYDAHADSMYYVQNGKRVSQPTVRKGYKVVLHVENYNNHLFHVQLKRPNASPLIARGAPLDLGNLGQGGGGNPLDLLFAGGSPLGGLPDLLGLSRGSGAAVTAAEQARQARMAEAATLTSTFNKAFDHATALAVELTLTEQKVKKVLEAQQIQAFAAEEIQALRLNPHLSPQQIKQLSQEYMSRIFDEADPRQVSLDKVLAKTDAKTEFLTLKKGYEAYVGQYAQDVDVMKTVSTALEGLAGEFPESNLGRFQREAAAAAAKAEQNLGTYQSNAEMLEAQSEGIQSLDVKKLSDLRVDYLVVMENDFSKTFEQQVTSDNMNLQLVFTPIDSVNISGVATKTAAPIEVKVYGGLQVNASLGLSFGQFFARPQSYFVRDSIVRSSDKDAFTPFLTSFVHFYPQGRREASLGGSFGVGIPLNGSGSSLEAITFFLGPCLILGRNQRIVLSAGLIGGRVEQLANGYTVGDRFELPPDFLQTESVYRLGYSVGLSFNLVGN